MVCLVLLMGMHLLHMMALLKLLLKQLSAFFLVHWRSLLCALLLGHHLRVFRPEIFMDIEVLVNMLLDRCSHDLVESLGNMEKSDESKFSPFRSQFELLLVQ
jgi:hypothetical protein